jgi:hypothetical protein
MSLRPDTLTLQDLRSGDLVRLSVSSWVTHLIVDADQDAPITMVNSAVSSASSVITYGSVAEYAPGKLTVFPVLVPLPETLIWAQPIYKGSVSCSTQGASQKHT